MCSRGPRFRRKITVLRERRQKKKTNANRSDSNGRAPHRPTDRHTSANDTEESCVRRRRRRQRPPRPRQRRAPAGFARDVVTTLPEAEDTTSADRSVGCRTRVGLFIFKLFLTRPLPPCPGCLCVYNTPIPGALNTLNVLA